MGDYAGHEQGEKQDEPSSKHGLRLWLSQVNREATYSEMGVDGCG